MKTHRPAPVRRAPAAFGFVLAFALAASAARAADDVNVEPTALDRYVAAPDPAYKWELAKTIPGEGATTYVLDLTSQTWRSAAEVDRPVWKHWLTVVVPDAALATPRDIAFLYIGGGSNKDAAPDAASERTLSLALDSGTAVAELGMVPNQPLAFADSPDKGRYEDDLIAYTRVKYIATKDETWLVRLAMVKSAVRAMDAMQEFLPEKTGGKVAPERFMVAGGSKRGWTTWLTGVVDERVAAIAPIVIDALNSQAITRHHYEAYGFFSTALEDYVNHGLFPHKVGTPEYAEILRIEDAWHYRNRERLRIPKFVVNASGDEFFLPDNSRFYYADMPGPKWLRYVENAKHSLAGSDARESLSAFYRAIRDGKTPPALDWSFAADGALVVRAEVAPKEAILWRATNPEARDFRLDTIGPGYAPTPLAPEADGKTFVARVAPPEKGFSAYFVQLTFDSGYDDPFKFSTAVFVTPDTLPFDFKDAMKNVRMN